VFSLSDIPGMPISDAGRRRPTQADSGNGRAAGVSGSGKDEPMSQLTVELLAGSRPRPRSSPWPQRFAVVADRLVAAYGLPSLGNLRDPVREIFYIVLSARTTDGQYRQTYRALRSRFPHLADLAAAPLREVRPCIAGGGLVNKRGGQLRRLAATLLSKLGRNPSRRLAEMSAREAYRFLTSLPGLGPKSALCVMMYSLDLDAFPVDVNVQRVACRLGAIPAGLKHYQAQQRLPALIPEGRSKELHIGLVVHGRTVCLPRNPRCESCILWDLCKFGKKKIGNRKDGSPP
jgi:endonuclease III